MYNLGLKYWEKKTKTKKPPNNKNQTQCFDLLV